MCCALFIQRSQLDAQIASPAPRIVPAPAIQDTTKHSPNRKNAPPDSEIGRLLPRITSKSAATTTPGALGLYDFRDHLLPELTIDVIDSLGKLYPELKGYLLQQAAIRGVLQIDLVERDRKKLLDRAFADMGLYGELEATLRHNQAVYGTIQNPMRPPPMPNQINLLDVIPAVMNILHALGLR